MSYFARDPKNWNGFWSSIRKDLSLMSGRLTIRGRSWFQTLGTGNWGGGVIKAGMRSLLENKSFTAVLKLQRWEITQLSSIVSLINTFYQVICVY